RGGLSIALHHVVGHEKQGFLVGALGEGGERFLRLPRVALGATEGVLDAAIALDEETDLLDLIGFGGVALEHRLDAVPLSGGGRSRAAMRGSVRLPSLRSAPTALPSRP